MCRSNVVPPVERTFKLKMFIRLHWREQWEWHWTICAISVVKQVQYNEYKRVCWSHVIVLHVASHAQSGARSSRTTAWGSPRRRANNGTSGSLLIFNHECWCWHRNCGMDLYFLCRCCELEDTNWDPSITTNHVVMSRATCLDSFKSSKYSGQQKFKFSFIGSKIMYLGEHVFIDSKMFYGSKFGCALTSERGSQCMPPCNSRRMLGTCSAACHQRLGKLRKASLWRLNTTP